MPYTGNFLEGGSGSDTLYSAGDSELRAGSGADTLHATTGDRISGDASDTLIFNGVQITGEAMFGARAQWLPGTERGQQVLDRDFVIFASPTFMQFRYDGTQSSITWDGWIVMDPDESNFDANGYFLQDTADACLTFQIGDFGINSDGLDANEQLDVGVRFTRNGRVVMMTTLPTGSVEGSSPDDYETDPGSFWDYTGITADNLSNFYGNRDDVLTS